MAEKNTAPDSLRGTNREYLREQDRTNELLADIAGVEYVSPGDPPKTGYMIEKRLLDAAQKKNELLDEIATGGGGGSASTLGLNIDYATDVISLKKSGEPIAGSGATLPAYGVSFDPTTGGLTLTKNGTAVQGQTVTIPNYGSPVAVTASSDMTDHDLIYLYEGTTGGDYTNGHFYYWDGSAWADGGEYAAATVQTDKTLLVEDRAADAKATGEAVGELKTHIDNITGTIILDNWVMGKRINTSGDTVDLSGETANPSSNFAYQIVDCTEGDTFTLTGTATNGAYRLWCWCTSDGTIVSRTDSNLAYTNELITCPATATKLLINVNKTHPYALYKGVYLAERVDELFEKHNNIVDPDDYTGTDNEKITQAMQTIGNDGDGVIILRRKFTLTENLKISHNGSVNKFIIFIGIGNEAGIDCGEYSIISYDSSKSYGALRFENLHFSGLGTFINSNYLIRVIITNCSFESFEHIVTAERFVQSYYFVNCLIRQNTGAAFYAPSVDSSTPSLTDLHISGCIVEWGAGLIDAYSLHGVYINNSCIEGMYDNVITATGDCRLVVVRDCYFESNNTGYNGTTDNGGIHFDFSNLSGNIHNVTIDACRFANLRATDNVLLLPNKPTAVNTHFTITNCIGSGSSPYVGLVAAHASANSQYINVIIYGNTTCHYNDPNSLLMVTPSIPTAPNTDGVYVLTCTVSSGVKTYSWMPQT